MPSHLASPRSHTHLYIPHPPPTPIPSPPSPALTCTHTSLPIRTHLHAQKKTNAFLTQTHTHTDSCLLGPWTQARGVTVGQRFSLHLSPCVQWRRGRWGSLQLWPLLCHLSAGRVSYMASNMFWECHCTGVVYNETAMLSWTFSPVWETNFYSNYTLVIFIKIKTKV